MVIALLMSLSLLLVLLLFEPYPITVVSCWRTDQSLDCGKYRMEVTQTVDK